MVRRSSAIVVNGSRSAIVSARGCRVCPVGVRAGPAPKGETLNQPTNQPTNQSTNTVFDASSTQCSTVSYIIGSAFQRRLKFFADDSRSSCCGLFLKDNILFRFLPSHSSVGVSFAPCRATLARGSILNPRKRLGRAAEKSAHLAPKVATRCHLSAAFLSSFFSSAYAWQKQRAGQRAPVLAPVRRVLLIPREGQQGQQTAENRPRRLNREDLSPGQPREIMLATIVVLPPPVLVAPAGAGRQPARAGRYY